VNRVQAGADRPVTKVESMVAWVEAQLMRLPEGTRAQRESMVAVALLAAGLAVLLA
jgi:hypothetical protein